MVLLAADASSRRDDAEKMLKTSRDNIIQQQNQETMEMRMGRLERQNDDNFRIF